MLKSIKSYYILFFIGVFFSNDIKFTYHREERDRNIEKFLFKADGSNSFRLFEVLKEVHENFNY